MSPETHREGSEPIGERKRVTLACQVCKKRKIRCDGNPEKCENCKGFGTECVYLESGIKRGPQKGYKSKRKRTEGENGDGRERRSFASGTDVHSQSPLTRGNQEPLPQPNRSTEWTERPREPGRSGSESASPPLRETCWSAMRTDLSRERPVAGTPRRSESDGQSTIRREQDPPTAGRDNGITASPDIGMAISALESLHEERNYTPRLPAMQRDDDNANFDPAFGAPAPPPQRQPLPRPVEGPQQTIPSVPASSRNSDDGMDTRCHDPNGLGRGAPDVRIDRQTQDRLLAIYWTHIHNVWPLLYKPEFYPSTVHRPLLLAMLAAASAIPTPGKTILNATQAEQLFTQAQDAILRRVRNTSSRDQFDEIAPAKSSLQTVQCLILFSLRQTSGGNKSSAYLWYCHAAAMALELGLHRVVLDKSKQSQAEIESRCRVFWTCYVLDKSFSEEMGRPVLLRASTTTTPLPSTHEADEFELWPPPSVSLGQKSRSRSHGDQRHIQPVKSRTITCFNATVRLAHIVEQCLDLDNELLLSSMSSVPRDTSRQLFVMDDAMIRSETASVEKQKEQLAQRLTDWWKKLDPDLRVESSAKICPPIHFVVNCAWYHSATIFLHSKNIGPKPPTGIGSEQYQASHRICSEAAGNIVSLLRCLDNFKILAPASSDIIHMLSHAALFHAYNAAIPLNEYAASAEANFQQCCLWLQEIGSFWAPASVQRQFFEGLVKGGKELTAMHRGTVPQRTEVPAQASSTSVVSPSQLLRQSPSLATSAIQQNSTAALASNRAGISQDFASSAANLFSVPDSSDISRVRSHFWNEFLPNTEQFNADRRESDFGAVATNMSDDLGSLYDLGILNHSGTSHYQGGQTVMDGGNATLAAFANLSQTTSGAFPVGTSADTGSTVDASNNIDPSDWLVAYMLDSIQSSKS